MHEPLEVRAGFSGGLSFFYGNMQIIVEGNPERTDNNYFRYSWRAVTENAKGEAFIYGRIYGLVLDDEVLRERIAIGLLKHFIRNREEGYSINQKVEIKPSEIRQERIAA